MSIQDRDYYWRDVDRKNAHRAQAARRSSPTARHLAFLVGWLALMAVMYVAVDAYLAPAKATVAANGDLRIPRSRDGHFYIGGTINGAPVTFLVDTGATTVVVSEATARKAGLQPGVPTTYRTANGLLAGRMVPGVAVQAGPLSVSSMKVGVGLVGHDAGQALLGQNFLSRFEVAISGQEMLIRAPE